MSVHDDTPPPSRGMKLSRGVSKETSEALSRGPRASKIRKYTDDPSTYNPTSPKTVEGRLSRYNPEDFFVPAGDDKGHYESVSGVRFHPTLYQEMGAVVNEGRLPVDSVHQFIRLAVYELLVTVHQIEEFPPNNMKVLSALNHINRRIEEIRRFTEQMDGIQKHINNFVMEGRHTAARKLIFDVIAQIKDLPDVEWRNFLMKDIQRKYGHILKVRKRRGRNEDEDEPSNEEGVN